MKNNNVINIHGV